jgi:hypothetical protein
MRSILRRQDGGTEALVRAEDAGRGEAAIAGALSQPRLLCRQDREPGVRVPGDRRVPEA